jgi:hypothetical protein
MRPANEKILAFLIVHVSANERKQKNRPQSEGGFYE